MSKDKDKLKAKKGRKFSNTSVTSLGNNQQRSKCKNVTRLSGDDGITKSKQLTQRKQTNRSIGRPKTRSILTNNNNEPRLCGNGIPMPSLNELEKIFEDSDCEEEPTVNTFDQTEPNYHNNVPRLCDETLCLSDRDKIINDPHKVEEEKNIKTFDNTILNSSDGCTTPKKNITISENNLNSPTTIKTIANKMLNYISNLFNPTALIDNAPRPAVVPPKKRKKPEQPYIVGCKDRAKVESRPNTSFCKGGDDYGVDINSDKEDEYPKKRAKRTKTANISKSIFNAKSDEIAARLKECEGDLSNESSNSNKIVAYKRFTPPSSGRSQSFSPLPSTSRDSETIHENDIRFNQSLVLEQPPNENLDDSVEVINNTPTTIVIDDEVVNTITALTNLPVIEIDDSREQVHIINDTVDDGRPNNIEDDDSCIEIIECNNNSIATRIDSPIQVEDYYSSLDLTQPLYDHFDEDVTEVIDVDDVIAENNAIIKKYRNSNDFDTVTFVEPNTNNIVSLTPHSIATESENREGSTTERILRQNSLSVDSDNAPGQPVLPILHIPNLPISQSDDVNGREMSIENRVRNFFNNNTGNNVESRDVNVRDMFIENRVNTGNNVDKSGNSHADAISVIVSKFMEDIRDRHIQNCSKVHDLHVVTSIPVVTETLLPKGLGDCPICMDRLNRQPVASTICGHIFCLACIKQAIKTSGKKCPTCRKTLKGIGFHQLFL